MLKDNLLLSNILKYYFLFFILILFYFIPIKSLSLPHFHYQYPIYIIILAIINKRFHESRVNILGRLIFFIQMAYLQGELNSNLNNSRLLLFGLVFFFFPFFLKILLLINTIFCIEIGATITFYA